MRSEGRPEALDKEEVTAAGPLKNRSVQVPQNTARPCVCLAFTLISKSFSEKQSKNDIATWTGLARAISVMESAELLFERESDGERETALCYYESQWQSYTVVFSVIKDK